LLTLGVAQSAFGAGDDFDPRGRRKPQHPPAGGGGNRKPPPGGGQRPQQPPTAPGASQQVLIDRYTHVVLSNPGSPFPLQRLAQLYREKDGNIVGLVKDFEARAAQAGAEQYAAMVTLAGVYKLDGRPDDAVKTLEGAIALKNNDAAAVLALAHLLQDRGDPAAARTRYEQALALQTVAADKEQTLRTLMTIALDAKDFPGAKGYHAQLVKMQPTSLFVRGELGRELYSRGEYEKAEVEFKDLVTAATGDNRTLAPALKDLGKAQAKAHKNQEALATLKRALQTSGSEAAVRSEIYETITEIYRADQQLPVLIKQIEDEHPTDFARLALLGALYEETGDPANALIAYKKALAINPRHIDLRLKLIRVLQSQGELDKAIAEYEGLIRAAPNNPQFVFEQCEALMQRGDRTRALKLLTELEARAQNDEESLSRLADFYSRIGEADKSLKVLSRLAQVGSNDPSHLVDLGDHYFQEGDKTQAIATWRRILTTITPRARALAALGDVYMEHEMLDDALTCFREAVQLDPGNVAFKKQLAGGLERKRQYKESRQVWIELAEKAAKTNDAILAREARTRIVTLMSLERILPDQVAPLTNKFNQSPPDLEAGRMLAEVHIHMRRLPDAESTLRKIIDKAPGDVETYLALERVLVQENKITDAIALLDKLVTVDPKRARELYQRMAQYALQIYKDDDAIKYAARAVELNPDDAEGHRRLGEMYRSRQDTDHAIQEFRAAIAKNDRLFIVYLELADLLLSKGQTDDADRLFRRVLRGAPDEELVARAARLSMQINLGRGTLESLEQELLPLAIGNPQRPIFRRILVEVYGNLTYALVARVRHGTGKDAEEARARLVKIGSRAMKPLLDALSDGDPAQQRIAIDVLGYVENKNAGLPLFAYATGPAETPLRARAMIACGALKDPALLPKYESLLFPKDQDKLAFDAISTDTVAVAASWAAAKVPDKRAAPLLRKVAQKGTPEMRAYALLGLGALHDKPSAELAAETARSQDAGTVARAAAAYALGELGADNESPTLLALAESADPLPRAMAALSLARLGAQKGASPEKSFAPAIADSLFSAGGGSDRNRASHEALRRAALGGLAILATKNAHEPRDVLPEPDDQLDADLALAELVPRDLSARERAQILTTFSDPIASSAKSALATSGDRARVVLDALSKEDSLEPVLTQEEAAASPDALAKLRALTTTLEPGVILLARHPDSGIRTRAIVFLSRSASAPAAQAMTLALSDSDPTVARIALSATGAHPSPATVDAVGNILSKHEAWSMRLLAAQAMGRVGKAGAKDAAAAHLTRAIKDEPFAIVREAALVALDECDHDKARTVAADLAAHDAEPRVRETAKRIVDTK
jgi:tetratricopeptide (TPR) repeat protein/HEAT repeat protein